MINIKKILFLIVIVPCLTALDASIQKAYAGAGGATSSESIATSSNVATESSTPSTVGQQNSIVQSPGSVLQFNSISTPPYQGCSGFCLYGRLGVANSNGNTLNISSSTSNVQAELGFTAQIGGSVEGKQVEATSKIAMMEQDRLDSQLNAAQNRELGKLIEGGKKAEAIGLAIAIFKRLGFSSHTELLRTMGAKWE